MIGWWGDGGVIWWSGDGGVIAWRGDTTVTLWWGVRVGGSNTRASPLDM